jgi:hypothetical protein
MKIGGVGEGDSWRANGRFAVGADINVKMWRNEWRSSDMLWVVGVEVFGYAYD